MNSIYINGIGCISSAGCSPKEIWESFSNKAGADMSPKRSYTSAYEKAKLRRMTDYAKLAAEVSLLCAIDAGEEDIQEHDNSNVGIVFTTGFGPTSSNLKFWKQVAKKEPDFCNPMVFAAIVPNYSLGNVCILLKIKGYSTTLMGGNPFDLALPVLNRGKADSMIIGAQEEFSEELFSAINDGRTNKEIPITECGVAFWTSCQKGDDCYAEVVCSGSMALDCSPIINDSYAFDAEVFEDINALIKEYSPDAAFGVGEGTSFGRAERQAIQGVSYIGDTRNIFGETLGCSFFANVTAAAICLKNGYIPFADINSPRAILVTGVDIQGSYMYVLLRSVRS